MGETPYNEFSITELRNAISSATSSVKAAHSVPKVRNSPQKVDPQENPIFSQEKLMRRGCEVFLGTL